MIKVYKKIIIAAYLKDIQKLAWLQFVWVVRDDRPIKYLGLLPEYTYFKHEGSARNYRIFIQH